MAPNLPPVANNQQNAPAGKPYQPFTPSGKWWLPDSDRKIYDWLPYGRDLRNYQTAAEAKDTFAHAGNKVWDIFAGGKNPKQVAEQVQNQSAGQTVNDFIVEPFKKHVFKPMMEGLKNPFSGGAMSYIAPAAAALGGLGLYSLFGKKKERQFSPQGGGQNININLGGGAAPGMFGYHRAGVSSLGAPTGLTSNYGMDNKFGMDMVKHAGFVSNALGNVVKNRMANQAVDSLLQSKPNEQKPEQPTQEEIQIAVKNPEVLKLLENEQNKAYLNRLLSEK
jgi:hypothetical protein